MLFRASWLTSHNLPALVCLAGSCRFAGPTRVSVGKVSQCFFVFAFYGIREAHSRENAKRKFRFSFLRVYSAPCLISGMSLRAHVQAEKGQGLNGVFLILVSCFRCFRLNSETRAPKSRSPLRTVYVPAFKRVFARSLHIGLQSACAWYNVPDTWRDVLSSWFCPGVLPIL